MSIIRDIVLKHINNYKLAKTGKWDKPEPPPKQTFTETDVYLIGNAIAEELEGRLADKHFKESPNDKE